MVLINLTTSQNSGKLENQQNQINPSVPQLHNVCNNNVCNNNVCNNNVCNNNVFIVNSADLIKDLKILTICNTNEDYYNYYVFSGSNGLNTLFLTC